MTDTDKDIEQLQAKIEAAKRRKEHDTKVQELQRQLAELEGPPPEKPTKKPNPLSGAGFSLPQLPLKTWLLVIGVVGFSVLFLVNRQLAIFIGGLGAVGIFVYYQRQKKH